MDHWNCNGSKFQLTCYAQMRGYIGYVAISLFREGFAEQGSTIKYYDPTLTKSLNLVCCFVR